MSKLFYINKTGLEIFDIFRVFGLAFSIRGVSNEDIDIQIKDSGYAFLLEAKGVLPNKPDPQLFLASENRWKNVFRTFRERKDSKVKPPWEEVKDIIENEYSEMINFHRSLTYVPEIGKQVKAGKTLYQSLDNSAAKGFREEKLGLGYHEGTQIQVDKFSWALGCLGATMTGTWMWGGDFILTLIPSPFNLSINSHRQIQEDMKQEKVTNISHLSAVAHFSVKLTEKIALRRTSSGMVYDSVVFNVMKKTGQQPKPGGGGKLGLEFLNALAKNELGIEVLKKFDFILRSGFVKGIKQSLALALTDFIIHPTIDNFSRCEDLNIRGNISENIPLWNRSELEVVMKNVHII
ncbi:MAG: hypothetical protein ACUVV4_07625 [Candidatus Bathyarchaeia archaeon]